MAILDYRLVRQGAQKTAAFEQEVQDLIGAGWQPHGFLQVVEVDGQPVLMQPMTMEESE